MIGPGHYCEAERLISEVAEPGTKGAESGNGPDAALGARA